jgi:predicted AAA+ superfamily ATPase
MTSIALDKGMVEQLKRVLDAVEQILPKPVPKVDWAVVHAANWRRRAGSGYLDPVPEIESMHMDDLLGIDEQKRMVENNTRQFLAGYPANNVLLWGTRGTGKSSLVRALLHSYCEKGLRVIQVDKDDLVHLPAIVDEVKREPYRFILFSDDVSFETGESSYKMLKSALDGSVYAPPENVLIYITSNRRHLLPEYESDNRGAMLVNNEIHHGETVEEKISLSGRFGLWIGFHPFNQDQFLDVTRQWVTRLSASYGSRVSWDEDARQAAILWCRQKGDNSGRIALQFANHWVGSCMMKDRQN